MSQPAHKLRPELVPLVDLLARAAYEAIKRGEFNEPRSLPDEPGELQKLKPERPAA